MRSDGDKYSFYDPKIKNNQINKNFILLVPTEAWQIGGGRGFEEEKAWRPSKRTVDLWEN